MDWEMVLFGVFVLVVVVLGGGACFAVVSDRRASRIRARMIEQVRAAAARERSSRLMRYGDDKTIHRTGEINVERDAVTGEVVSVWFRCMPLPFTDHAVGPPRAAEMRQMYQDYPPRPLTAVVLVDDAERGGGDGEDRHDR